MLLSSGNAGCASLCAAKASKTTQASMVTLSSTIFFIGNGPSIVSSESMSRERAREAMMSTILTLIMLSFLVGVRAQMVSITVSKADADKWGAACLSGAPPSYEIDLRNQSKNWVLFLEGGGWCNGLTAEDTIKSCAGRAGFKPIGGNVSVSTLERRKSDRFAADGFASTIKDYGGILSSDPNVNPDFHTWNAVFIHYCDGASFGGGRVDSVAVETSSGEPASMWLRGRNNFDAVIDDLRRRHGMAQEAGSEVILSGGSAGGLAVFYNLDHLADTLGSEIRLTGFPDAGFFLDALDASTGDYTYRKSFIGADPVWNVTGSGGTNRACLEVHARSKP